MSKIIEIKYYMHSGFSCSIDNNLYIFDYWEGEKNKLQQNVRLDINEECKKYKTIYFFVSHSHPDHYDPIIYKWKHISNVKYIISYDLPDSCIGNRMYPNEKIQLEENITVTSYESTDIGVAFLLTVDSVNIFHAGDLNFWHWSEESTAREIEEAEVQFKNAVSMLSQTKIDISFFPVDPRQGKLYDAGANYFIMTIKPRLLIPMHFWNRNAVITEFSNRCKTSVTEIIPMTRQGERMIVEYTDDEYMIINTMNGYNLGINENDVANNFKEIQDDNPFNDSDLPVQLNDK